MPRWPLMQCPQASPPLPSDCSGAVRFFSRTTTCQSIELKLEVACGKQPPNNAVASARVQQAAPTGKRPFRIWSIRICNDSRSFCFSCFSLFELGQDSEFTSQNFPNALESSLYHFQSRDHTMAPMSWRRCTLLSYPKRVQQTACH